MSGYVRPMARIDSFYLVLPFFDKMGLSKLLGYDYSGKVLIRNLKYV